jgi:hypothetical protein
MHDTVDLHPSVSIVIVTYTVERWAVLLAAIESMRAQTVPVHEIVVVVDRNDELMARLRASSLEVKLLMNDRDPGASGARNAGVAVATGSVVAFLDDDALAEPDWLELMIPFFADAAVLGIGGHLEPEWAVPRPTWFPDEFLWVVGCSYTGLPDEVAPVRNLIAASMLMRRDAFLEVGGFRPGFGKLGQRSGVEETDLCIRASHARPGSVWLHHPQAKATHAVPEARTHWQYYLRRCQDEGVAKASLSAFVGSASGLSSERRYVLRILPAGLLRGVGESLRGDPAGVLRSGAILAGLLSTGFGYIRGKIGLATASRRQKLGADGPD